MPRIKSFKLARRITYGSILLAALISLTQFTRFTNIAEIKSGGGKLKVIVDGAESEVNWRPTSVIEVGVELEKEAAQENYLASFSLTADESKLVAQRNSSGVFLFGDSLLNSFTEGDYLIEDKNFADWYMPPNYSRMVPLYSGAITTDFHMKFEFLGRGRKSIKIGGAVPIEINIHDGYINNAYAVCTPDGCPIVIDNHEKSGTNFKRFLNFWLECGVLAVLIYVVLGGAFARVTSKYVERSERLTLVILGIVLVAHFAIATWFSGPILGSMPHVPDSAVYYRQGIMMSQGLLKIDNFDAVKYEAAIPTGGIVRDKTLHFHYNHFWPALIAISILGGFVSILVPLLSTANVLLVFLIGTKLFNSGSGLVAALIFALSPLAVIQTGDYMNHVACLSFLLLGYYAGLKFQERRAILIGLVAAAAWAYAFAIRPLTAVSVIIPLAFSILVKDFRLLLSWRFWLAACGSLPVVLLLLLDNKLITDGYLDFPASKFHALSLKFEHLSYGLNWGDSTVGALIPQLWGWYLPQIILGFAILASFVGGGLRALLVLSCLPVVMIAYWFNNSYGLHGYGPRFYYEAASFIYIPAGFALYAAYTYLDRQIRPLFGLFCAVFLVGGVFRLIQVLPKYRDYNTIHQDVFDQISAVDLTNSLTLGEGGNWQAGDNFAKLFDPTFRDRLFVHTLPNDKHLELIRQESGRRMYAVKDRVVYPYVPPTLQDSESSSGSK